MTLFVFTPRRILEIDDAYVMALTFLVFFSVGRIVKAVIERKKKNTGHNTQDVDIPNPRGGNVGLEFSDDTELEHTILSCIADNEQYLLKDSKLINIVFKLAKVKLKNESLVLTPNLIRFVALKLLNNDQTLIVKIGNIVASSNNRARLLSRAFVAAILGTLAGVGYALPGAVLMAFAYYDATENCSFKCSDYFEQLPKEGPVQIYGKESTGHIVIGGNDDARQLEIYIPSKDGGEVTVKSNGELKTTRTYTKVRPKAKQVKFSDFKRNDPVLSKFKDLDEPEVPQKRCPSIHEIIDDL